MHRPERCAVPAGCQQGGASITSISGGALNERYTTRSVLRALDLQVNLGIIKSWQFRKPSARRRGLEWQAVIVSFGPLEPELRLRTANEAFVFVVGLGNGKAAGRELLRRYGVAA